jgi:hypothetical protein
MKFIEPELKIALSYLRNLDVDQTPKWGSLSSIGMVEHLTDSLNMASGKSKHDIEVPEKYWSKMNEILASENGMPKNFKATFAPENRTIRNENLTDALAEFERAWIEYDRVFEENERLINNHPNYGPLNKSQWKRLLSKHLTHHFEQFSIHLRCSSAPINIT